MAFFDTEKMRNMWEVEVGISILSGVSENGGDQGKGEGGRGIDLHYLVYNYNPLKQINLKRINS